MGTYPDLEDGADCYLSAAQRCSPDYFTIPRWAADLIVDALRSLPKGTPGRPDLWSPAVETQAVIGLLNDRPIHATAREIAELTGQPEGSARRRLQKMNKSGHLKELRTLKADFLRRAPRD